MAIDLYSIAISHPSRAAKLMLRHKGLDAEVHEMPPGAQQLVMRALGFRRGTVPGLRAGRRRVQGTREISRFLDEFQPEPPLFPADPSLRAQVEEAERWGDETYQPVPRRIFRYLAASDGELRTKLMGGAGVPVPPVAARLMWPVMQGYMRMEGGGESAARRDVAAVPSHLDHVDALIADGIIGGTEPNAADFQIAVTTWVLQTFPQIAPLLEDRPALAHAARIVAQPPRGVGLEFPADWLQRAAA